MSFLISFLLFFLSAINTFHNCIFAAYIEKVQRANHQCVFCMYWTHLNEQEREEKKQIQWGTIWYIPAISRLTTMPTIAQCSSTWTRKTGGNDNTGFSLSLFLHAPCLLVDGESKKAKQKKTKYKKKGSDLRLNRNQCYNKIKTK